jgi:hypothetical protein
MTPQSPPDNCGGYLGRVGTRATRILLPINEVV